jgi:hypothetical protein
MRVVKKMPWDDIDWSKPDLPRNPPPVPEEDRLEPPKSQMKEKRLWDGVDTSDRTRGKCKSCGISPENISVSTGNCYDCDDKQPQLFDYQLKPTQIHGRSVHAGLLDGSPKFSAASDAEVVIQPEDDRPIFAQGRRPVAVIETELPDDSTETNKIIIGRPGGFHRELGANSSDAFGEIWDDPFSGSHIEWFLKIPANREQVEQTIWDALRGSSADDVDAPKFSSHGDLTT